VKKLDRLDVADDTLELIVALVRWIVRILRGAPHEQASSAPSQDHTTPPQQP
jgi:hypothetical protein